MSQLIKHTSGPVDPANPWSDDVLKRGELAEQLTTALSTLTQPFVLGLHAEFGNGKTFFIDRWRQELINAGDVAVYFNAWETDYAAEPLIAFTAAIKKQLQEHDLGVGKNPATALATSAGRIVARSVLPRFASLLTGGFVQASELSALTAIADDAAGAASDITNRAIEDVVKHHEKARDEVEHFRSILSDCAQAITTRASGGVNRLIIFVDELDRCRPDYAVHVLECIKHFFAVDNVIFVIAVDRKALDASIRSVYGNGIDVSGYLRRFFDYHVEFSASSHEEFAVMLAQSLRLEEASPSRHTDLARLFSELCEAFDFTLRTQAQIMSETSFLLRIHRSDWFISDLTLILLCLRAKDASLFDRLYAQEPNVEELFSEARKLVRAGSNNEDVDHGIKYAVTMLAAGFASYDAMREQYRRGKKQVETKDSTEDLLTNVLEDAIDIIQKQIRGQFLGREVIRRIRFITG